MIPCQSTAKSESANDEISMLGNILPTGDPTSKQPCYIMCLDSSGMLFRLPISLLKNQNNLGTHADHKINEGIFSNINSDNAKPPIAVIPPFNAQNISIQNAASKLQSNEVCYQGGSDNSTYTNTLLYQTDNQHWSSDNLYQPQDQINSSNRQYLLNDATYYQCSDPNTPEVSEYITIDQGAYSVAAYQMNHTQSTSIDQDACRNLKQIGVNKNVNLVDAGSSGNQHDQNYLALLNSHSDSSQIDAKKNSNNMVNNCGQMITGYGTSLNPAMYQNQNTFQSLKFGEGFNAANQWQNYQSDGSANKLLTNVQSNKLFNSSKLEEFGSLTAIDVINNAQQKLMFVNSNLCRPHMPSSYGQMAVNQNISAIQQGQNFATSVIKSEENMDKKSIDELLKTFGGNTSTLKEDANAALIAKLLFQSKQFLSKSTHQISTSQNNAYIQQQAPIDNQLTTSISNKQITAPNSNRLADPNSYMQYAGVRNQIFKNTAVDLNNLKGARMAGNNRMALNNMMPTNVAYNQSNTKNMHLNQNMLNPVNHNLVNPVNHNLINPVNQNLADSVSQNMVNSVNQTANQSISFEYHQLLMEKQKNQIVNNCNPIGRPPANPTNINALPENASYQMRSYVPGNIQMVQNINNNSANVNSGTNIVRKAVASRKNKSAMPASNADTLPSKAEESIKIRAEGALNFDSKWPSLQEQNSFDNNSTNQVQNLQSNSMPSVTMTTGPPIQQSINSSPTNLQSEASGSTVGETTYVPGQEYNISYSNGRQVTAVWDGKYFKIKQPPPVSNANSSSMTQQMQLNNLSPIKTTGNNSNPSNFVSQQNEMGFTQVKNSYNFQHNIDNNQNFRMQNSACAQVSNTDLTSYTQLQSQSNSNYTEMQNTSNTYTQMLNTATIFAQNNTDTTSFTQMLNAAATTYPQNSFQHAGNSLAFTPFTTVSAQPPLNNQTNQYVPMLQENQPAKRQGKDAMERSLNSNLASTSDQLNVQQHGSNTVSISFTELQLTRPHHQQNIQDTNLVTSDNKLPKRQVEEGKFAVCRRCGHMSLNYTMCESCGRSLPDDVQFFMPDKKMKTGDNTSSSFQVPAVKASSPRKAAPKPTKGRGSKRTTFGHRKETDVVHILSSDDEEKVDPSPPTTSQNNLKVSIELGGCARSFVVQLEEVYFGKIHCKWIKTCTVEADRLILSGTGLSGNTIKLMSTSLELMLLAAFFQPGACSHIFLHTHFTSALKFIRESVPNSRLLYDSECQDDCAKYIVLFLKLEEQASNLETRIPEVVGAMQQFRQAKMPNSNLPIGPLYKTIDSFEVTAFMNSVKASGNLELGIPTAVISEEAEGIEGEELMHSINKMRSSTFSSNIIHLFTYPPPPATGGIPVSNEDLFCLNEGEFLNDVIIDFYLKYLSLELLVGQFSSTHIFSSFFFKRLTQRLPSKRNDEETMDMSVQQKRHANVRTWTRHVDLFSKDFVVVPINENAHWYLAIICYPGLEASELEPKVESPVKTDNKPTKTKKKKVPTANLR